MRFEFYTEALANVPKLSVDGTVDNSIHFSHWEGNTTPAELKADTSTEIALNLVASPNRATLTNDNRMLTRFNEACLKRGVLKGHSKIYVSCAHTEDDLVMRSWRVSFSSQRKPGTS